MPDTQATISLISNFLNQEVLTDSESLAPDDDLLTSGLVDSISMMRLISHVEKSLELKIPPQDLVPKNFRNIQTIAQFLNTLPS